MCGAGAEASITEAATLRERPCNPAAQDGGGFCRVCGIYNPFPRPPEIVPRPTQYPRRVDLKPSPELAYVIGVVLGDGSTFRHKYGCYIVLRAIETKSSSKSSRGVSPLC